MAFDKDFQKGHITAEKLYANATEDAVLAYKPLRQAGHVDHFFDEALLTKRRPTE